MVYLYLNIMIFRLCYSKHCQQLILTFDFWALLYFKILLLTKAFLFSFCSLKSHKENYCILITSRGSIDWRGTLLSIVVWNSLPINTDVSSIGIPLESGYLENPMLSTKYLNTSTCFIILLSSSLNNVVELLRVKIGEWLRLIVMP